MIALCPDHECTGCGACYNACAFAAIAMAENAWGEMVPMIDEGLCAACGRCVRACPVLTPLDRTEPVACFAAWAADASEAQLSSSGAAAAVFAKHVARLGGAAVGAVFSQATIQHAVATTTAQVELFRGSKYAQSQTGLVYREIEEHLRSGTRVLFTGTPCQTAGLQGYLGRRYENLICVDFVCHGVPPAAYLREHVEGRLRSDSQEPISVTFRDGGTFQLRLRDANRVLYSRRWVRDVYYYAFMKGVTYRDSCYACQFASTNRCSDITVGDFWGLDRESLDNPYEGRVSLVLVNTEMGASFLEEVGDSLYTEQRLVSEAISGNPQLRSPAKQHPKRAAFRAAYPSSGFCGAMRRSGVRTEVKIATVKDGALYRWLRAAKRLLRNGGTTAWSGRT